MRPGKIIPSASALPVPAERPGYQQRPCCWPFSRAEVATHLVAQEEGTSLSYPDSSKVSRDALAPGARAKQLTVCLAGAGCSHAPCAEGVNPRRISSSLPVSGACSGPLAALGEGLFDCGTAWLTDVAALPRDANHPLSLEFAAFLLPTKCTAGNMKAQSA